MRWGQWEEGITGTTIKDTWTKSRVSVEVGDGCGFFHSVVVKLSFSSISDNSE